MLGDKVHVEINGNEVKIINVTQHDLHKCYVIIKNIFYNILLDKEFNLPNGGEIILKLNNYAFRDNWESESLFVDVYEKNKTCFSKVFFDKTKCFVLLSNKSFEKLTEQLIIGLKRYSNFDILHYTINYKSNLEYSYLQNINYNIDYDSEDPQYMQFVKPLIFLDVIKRGYSNAAFIDSDIQVRPTIKDLFNYLSYIEDGPVFHKSYWDYTLHNQVLIPGPLLSNFMGITKQEWPHGVTNVMLFSNKHYNLFLEWRDICLSVDINDIRKKEFLHDELILNCLMWKNKIKPKYFFFALNILSDKDVEFFYNYKFIKYKTEVNLNDYNLGQLYQSFMPYEKSSIIGFHCVKDVDLAKKINDMILDNENIHVHNIYDKIPKNDSIIVKDFFNFDINFVDGATFNYRGGDGECVVKFYNKDKLEYESKLKENYWAKVNKKFFVDWKIEYTNNSIKSYVIPEFKDKNVFICFESSSLGDTLAWIPYVEEFRVKHKCKVICTTFHNNLFIDEYKEIDFVEPGTIVHNLFALYRIGWYYKEDGQIDYDRNPINFRLQPLQKTASDILGLDFKEIKPKIRKSKLEKKKQITIGIHSTAQAKYWNNENGWQEVVNWCVENGYTVKILSREEDGFMGNYYPKGAEKHPVGTLESVIDELVQSKVFLGIGSGLSWLSWACDTPTVLISGFSEAYTEPSDCFRVEAPENTCSGCFNKYRLDPSDWLWCPEHKNTERMFECSKKITSDMVIRKIEEVLEKKAIM